MGYRCVWALLIVWIAPPNSVRPVSFSGHYDQDEKSKFTIIELVKTQNQYTGEVFVGRPPQKLRMLFDTGSFESWIPFKSFRRESGYQYNYHGLVSGKNVSLSYVTGLIEGQLIFIDVTIGSMSLSNHQFLLAINASKLFSNVDFDGIVSLPPSRGPRSDGLLNNLRKQNLIAEEIFAIRFDDENERGELWIGSAPLLPSQSETISVSLRTHSHTWAFDFDSITVNGNIVCSERCHAIADTGSPLIVGPLEDVASIFKLIGCSKRVSNAHGFTFATCVMNSKTFPSTVDFTIMGIKFILQPKDYLSDCAGNECYVGIVGTERLTSHSWIFGHLFLKHFLTTFNVQQRQISFSRICGRLDKPADDDDKVKSNIPFCQSHETRA